MAQLISAGVELRSVPGRGTTVALTGLCVTEPPPAPSRPDGRPRSNPPQSLLQGLRVLLIEDDPAVLLSTQMLMERWGCTVHAHQ
ncbi:response regulator, partial [Paracoccus sp. PXZ]